MTATPTGAAVTVESMRRVSHAPDYVVPPITP